MYLLVAFTGEHDLFPVAHALVNVHLLALLLFDCSVAFAFFTPARGRSDENTTQQQADEPVLLLQPFALALTIWAHDLLYTDNTASLLHVDEHWPDL